VGRYVLVTVPKRVTLIWQVKRAAAESCRSGERKMGRAGPMASSEEVNEELFMNSIRWIQRR
jgi:hypothetical protein